MPLHPPLDQFADRLIRNGELRTFVQGLLERGVTPQQLLAAMKPNDRGPADDQEIIRWFKAMISALNEVSNHRDVAGLDQFMKTHVPMNLYG